MEYHEAANIFPMMNDEALERLAEDITQRGQCDSIDLLDGKILDGRNRFAACGLAGVTPRFCNVTVEDPVAYVLSKNLHRRHLTPSQAGMVASRARAYYDRQAKERQRATLKRGDKAPVPVNLPERDHGDARDLAGQKVGVSGSTVDHATKVLKYGVPELVKAVDEGRISVSMAAKTASLDAETQKKVAEGAKFTAGRYRNAACASPGTTGKPVVRTPASSAMEFALMAISQLERIQRKDPNRDKAYARVESWISKQRSEA